MEPSNLRKHLPALRWTTRTLQHRLDRPAWTHRRRRPRCRDPLLVHPPKGVQVRDGRVLCIAGLPRIAARIGALTDSARRRSRSWRSAGRHPTTKKRKQESNWKSPLLGLSELHGIPSSHLLSVPPPVSPVQSQEALHTLLRQLLRQGRQKPGRVALDRWEGPKRHPLGLTLLASETLLVSSLGESH